MPLIQRLDMRARTWIKTIHAARIDFAWLNLMPCTATAWGASTDAQCSIASIAKNHTSHALPLYRGRNR